MKAPWPKTRFTIAILLGAAFMTAPSGFAQKKISRKSAAIIVEGTDEVAALYKLNNGRFSNCIEKSVELPCESDWVSCIDDAWVVRFYVGEQCENIHDERLSVTMVVRSDTGRIISRFPELDYFLKNSYCRDDFDCLQYQVKEFRRPSCVNFIHAMANKGEWKETDDCTCLESQCVLSEEALKTWQSLDTLDAEEIKKILFVH